MNLFTKQAYRYQKQTYSYWRGNMGWRADKLGDWSWHIHTVCVCAQSLQSCPTLCDLKDCSPPGCSVHEILQARILEWVAMPSSRGSSWPNDWTHVSCISCIADRFFTTEPPRCSTCTLLYTQLGFPSGSAVENLPAMEEGSIAGSGRSPGEGNGNPLQYSCLENLMDRGAWQATIHGVTKSQTLLSD